jgi:hypothetical protein
MFLEGFALTQSSIIELHKFDLEVAERIKNELGLLNIRIIIGKVKVIDYQRLFEFS